MDYAAHDSSAVTACVRIADIQHVTSDVGIWSVATDRLGELLSPKQSLASEIFGVAMAAMERVGNGYHRQVRVGLAIRGLQGQGGSDILVSGASSLWRISH